jgi:hypothetical protein
MLMGDDFVETDIVASRLMGFKVEEIPYLNHFLHKGQISKAEIEIKSSDISTTDFFDDQNKHLLFEPPTHWQNLI